MKITPLSTEELIYVNRQFGGSVLNNSSIHFAEKLSTMTKSRWKKAAIWTRAIVVDHPFLDGNKRTALYAIGRHVKIRDPVQMSNAIIKIAKLSIGDIEKIVEVLKNANR